MMKPASFTYKRAESLEEVFELLEEHMDEAKIIAGGQSLVPMMNMRLARPAYLIDINNVKGLDYIREENGRIHIGALTRQCDLEQSPLLKEKCPIIPHGVTKIGHYSIRQRGTLGGSLVHADPSAELPVLASLFNANIHIASSEEQRTVPATEFFITIYTTDLMPTEIVTAVDFPVMDPHEGWSYQDFTRRVGDFAIVSVAVTVKLDQEEKVENMRMVIGGAETIPFNLQEMLQSYIGKKADDEWLTSLAEEAVSMLEPGSDIHASEEDRRELLHVLIPKAVKEAIQRAEQKGDRVHG